MKRSDVKVFIPIDQDYRDMLPFGTKLPLKHSVKGDTITYTMTGFEEKWARIFGVTITYVEGEQGECSKS